MKLGTVGEDPTMRVNKETTNPPVSEVEPGEESDDPETLWEKMWAPVGECLLRMRRVWVWVMNRERLGLVLQRLLHR